MKTLSLGLAVLLVIAIAARGPAAADDKAADKAKAGKFTPLFNGKNLDGWQGDKDLWKVVDGVIVGSTDGKELTHNSFLSTAKPYKNFILKMKFKLRNHNSGVQYRSKQLDDHVVAGYQADIADERYMGILYEEKGRGILADVVEEEVNKHVKPGEWNQYVITAQDGHLIHKLNDFVTVDYYEQSDEGAKAGIIAFQLHTGPKMQVEFKDVEIEVLP